MRRTLAWTLLLLALVLVMSACNTKQSGPAPEELTEAKASTMLLEYESGIIGKAKYNPHDYVTGPEQQWLDQFLADANGGQTLTMPWAASGTVFKLEKVTKTEAQMLTQLQDNSNGTYVTFHFKMVPVNGKWKIYNHTTDNGKWFTPLATTTKK